MPTKDYKPVKALSTEEARELTDFIKAHVAAAWIKIKEAYDGRAWVALGYESWDVYCIKEFGACQLRIPREERPDMVRSLREAGLSIRAIASATRTGKQTVQDDLAATATVLGKDSSPATITGTDGKTRPAKASAKKAAPKPKLTIVKDAIAPKTKPEPAPAAEDVDVATEVKEMVPQLNEVVEKVGSAIIGPLLVHIARELDGVADYVKALDYDGRVKLLAEHKDAIQDVALKLKFTIDALNRTDKKRQKDAIAAKQEGTAK